MIKRLILKNFQKHKHLDITFDPGITLILGQGNAGKTAIFRSIDGLVSNRPTNIEKIYQTIGNDKLEITLFVDNYKIIRKDKSYTLINLKTNSKEIFKAIGSDVPEPIKQVIDLKPINWQNQFDNPYLIMNTGGNAAKSLNKALENEELESILKTIKADTTEAKSSIRSLTRTQQDLKSKLDSFSNLDEWIIYFKSEVEPIHEELEDNKITYEKLKILIQDLNRVKTNLDSLQSVHKIRHLIDIITKTKQEKEELLHGIQELSQTISSIKKTESQQKKKIPADKIKKMISEISNLKQKILDREAEQDKLRKVIDLLDNTKDGIKNLNQWVTEGKKKLDRAFKDLGYCPLCGSKK